MHFKNNNAKERDHLAKVYGDKHVCILQSVAHLPTIQKDLGLISGVTNY